VRSARAGIGGIAAASALICALSGCPSEPIEDTPTPLARLNPTAVDHIARDVLGSRLSPSSLLPMDPAVEGFDNLSDGQVISASALRLYARAGEELAAEAFAVGTTRSLDLLDGCGRGMFCASFDADAPGLHRIEVTLFWNIPGITPVPPIVLLDGEILGMPPVDGDSVTLEIDVPLFSGAHELTVVPSTMDGTWTDIAFMPGPATVAGPRVQDPDMRAPLRVSLDTCLEGGEASACIGDILHPIQRLAWRHDLSDEEASWSRGLWDAFLAEGADPVDAARWALLAILTAPEFLYRPERIAAAAGDRLSGNELASRLSFWLWASVPDSALLDAAAAGELDTDEGVLAQVRRMMDDPRSASLVHDFAGQWLGLRDIAKVELDTDVFPEFSVELRGSMQEEVRHRLQSMLFDERPWTELLVDSSSRIDGRLADLYGVSAPDDWTTVDLSGVGRTGLLGTAGWLAARSRPGRRSIPARGVWILDRLLCRTPGAPPAGVPPGAIDDAGEASARRTDPACASCHAEIDGLGLGLEQFDASGADRGAPEPVTLPDGSVIDDALDLSGVLAADPDLLSCAVRKSLTYALGRAGHPTDERRIEDLLVQWEEDGLVARSLFERIAVSDAFTRAQPPEVVE